MGFLGDLGAGLTAPLKNAFSLITYPARTFTNIFSQPSTSRQLKIGEYYSPDASYRTTQSYNDRVNTPAGSTYNYYTYPQATAKGVGSNDIFAFIKQIILIIIVIAVIIVIINIIRGKKKSKKRSKK